MRFPKLAGIDLVDRLPDFRLAHPLHPVGGEIAVVKLLHLPRQPALDMHAVGDVADGNFLFHAPRPEVRPHPPRNMAVQIAHGVRAARELESQHGHAERFVVVLRLDAADAHQLVERDAQLVAQRSEMLFDQVLVEAVVSGGHGRVRGEDRMLGDIAQRGVEGHAVVLHPLAAGFQRGERAMPFVQVINAGRDAQRLRAPGRRPRRPPVPGGCACGCRRRRAGEVNSRSSGLLLGTSQSKQIQMHAAHAHQPHFGQQLAAAGVDRDGDRLAVDAQGRLHRQVLDLRVEIFFVLPAVDVQMLLEIALIVEQPDGHQAARPSRWRF